MAYANGAEHCASTMVNTNDDHMHQCVFAADHTDSDYEGSHQCECGEVW